MVFTAKEFSEKWKIDIAFVYKLVDKEGMPCECRKPLRLGDKADEFMRNRGRKEEQKEG